MRELIVKMSMTLDGFVCGPNGELDWMFRTTDAQSTAWVVDAITGAGMHLMGRKTFADMAAYWPSSTEPFAAPMNEVLKGVFTRHANAASETTRALRDARAHQPDAPNPAAAANQRSWDEARVFHGDLADEIATLKRGGGDFLLAHGGASFMQALVATGLVDEFRLAVHPIALGGGLRLFGTPLALELVSVSTFPCGTTGCVYRPKAS
jgi:dihydrofolate reductase